MSVLRTKTLCTTGLIHPTGFIHPTPFHHQHWLTWPGGKGDFEGAPSPAGTSVLPMSGARTAAKFFTENPDQLKAVQKEKPRQIGTKKGWGFSLRV